MHSVPGWQHSSSHSCSVALQIGMQIAPFQQDSFGAQQCPGGPQNGRPSGGHGDLLVAEARAASWCS